MFLNCRPVLRVLIAGVAFAIVAFARADVNRWSGIGPYGPISNAAGLVIVRVDPHSGDVYAGTETGLSRSEDGGSTWTCVPAIHDVVSAIAFDATEPGTMYVSDYELRDGVLTNQRVLKTTDAGLSWTIILKLEATDDPSYHPSTDILVDRWSPSTLYVHKNGFLGSGQTILKSKDGGMTWSTVSTGALHSPKGLVLDPELPETLYAISNGTVIKSMDGGETWRLVDTRLGNVNFTSLMFAGTSPPTLLAFEAGGGRLYRSVDHAASWAPIETRAQLVIADERSPAVYAVSLSFDPPQVISTLDGGTTWSALGWDGIHPIAIKPGSGSTVWGASDDSSSLYMSLDGGASWNSRTDGLGDFGVDALAGIPCGSENCILTLSGPRFHRTEGGGAWEEIRDFGVEAIAADPGSVGTLYAAADSGFYASLDSGRTWELAGPTRWMSPVAAVADGRGSAYLLGSGIAVLFRTMDGGKSWTWSRSGLPAGPSVPEARSLIVDPTSETVLYAGFRAEGVFKSRDGGMSWAAASAGLPEGAPLTTLAIAPGVGVLYAAISGHGVFSSRDGGSHWEPSNRGLPAVEVLSLAVDPSRPSNLYAGTGGEGVFRSVDGGSVWLPFSVGLGDGFVRALSIPGSQPAHVYAGTRKGVFVATVVDQECGVDLARLCLGEGRFHVRVDWRDAAHGRRGLGQAVALTPDTGHFWFFGEDNVELVVKVLDGRGVNGHFWVFYGALSDVEYTITVEDTQTGEVRRYFNPHGALASAADTKAFPVQGGATAAVGSEVDLYPNLVDRAVRPFAANRSETAAGVCVAESTNLCLNRGRYRVEATWQTRDGSRSAATAVPLTSETGYFWFFDEDNVELVVKVLDGTAVNGHTWVLHGALSDVRYAITVTDTQTGAVRIYENPAGTLASGADTAAF